MVKLAVVGQAVGLVVGLAVVEQAVGLVVGLGVGLAVVLVVGLAVELAVSAFLVHIMFMLINVSVLGVLLLKEVVLRENSSP